MANVELDASLAERLDYRRRDAWEALSQACHSWPARLTVGCGWVSCEPGWSWKALLSDFDVWSVVAGRGNAWLSGAHVRLRPGTTLVLRPGDHVQVRQHPIDRLTVAYVHYTYGAGRNVTGAPPAWLPPPRVVELDDAAAVQQPLRTAITRATGHDVAAAVQAAALLGIALLELHVQAARHLGHLPPLMDRRIRIAVDTLRAGVGERITLDDAARAARLSPTHFSRLFREQVGRSFREFCVDTRVDRGRELLTQTPLSVAEIARLLGYSDYRLFARQFAARYGCAPSAWRGQA